MYSTAAAPACAPISTARCIPHHHSILLSAVISLTRLYNTPQLRDFAPECPTRPHHAGTLSLSFTPCHCYVPNPPGRGATRPVRSALSTTSPSPYHHREVSHNTAKPQKTPRTLAGGHPHSLLVARSQVDPGRIHIPVYSCAQRRKAETISAQRATAAPAGYLAAEYVKRRVGQVHRDARHRRPCPEHPGSRAACFN